MPDHEPHGKRLLQFSTENSYTSGIHILDVSGLKGDAMHGQQLHETPADQTAGDGAVHDEFGGLPAGVRAERPEEVAAYLQVHPQLARLIPDVCERARKEFGVGAELVLKIYRDPEIEDRYLTLYVRLPAYDGSITARLDRVTEPFDEALCNVSGHFLVTTDFRAAGTGHGV